MFFLVARFAETSVGVAVVVLARVAVGADSSDSDVLGSTYAGLGGFRVVLVDSGTGSDVAGLGVLVVGFLRSALAADAVDDVVALGAVALARVEVVDLVVSALDSAYSLVNVVELALGTLGAVVVDQVVSRFADASVQDVVLVDRTNRNALALTSLTGSLLEARFAVAALDHVVVELGLGVAGRAHALDEVVAGKAAASPDDGVPHFVVLARNVANSVSGVVNLSGRTEAAAVANEVVSLLANALATNELFVRVACRHAKTEVLDVSFIAGAGFGDGVVAGVENAGLAGAVGHLPKVGKADAFLKTDVPDVVSAAGDSADAKSLVVNFVPVANAANSLDGVVANFAAAKSVVEDLVGSASGNTVSGAVESESWRTGADLVDGVVGGVGSALGADVVDEEVLGSALANTLKDVVDLVGGAGDSADGEVDIVESALGTNDASAVDLVETGLADTETVDEEGVGVGALTGRVGQSGGRSGRVGLGDAHTAAEGVSLDAVADLGGLVVDRVGGT